MMSPRPNLSQAYRLILQEEKQRDCHHNGVPSHDSVAFASNFPSNSFTIAGNHKAKSNSSKTYSDTPSHPYQHSPVTHVNSGHSIDAFGISPSGRRSKFFCTHCKMWGYSFERCFKIHGYPPGSKSSFKGKRIAGSAQGSLDIPTGSVDIYHQSTAVHSLGTANAHITPNSSGPPSTISQSQYDELISLLKQHKVDGFSGFVNSSSAFMAGEVHNEMEREVISSGSTNDSRDVPPFNL